MSVSFVLLLATVLGLGGCKLPHLLLTLCLPSKVSTTRGRNLIPSSWQAAVALVIFVPYRMLRAWPGVTATSEFMLYSFA